MKFKCNRYQRLLISFLLVLSCVSPFLIQADTIDGTLYGIDVSSWQDTINWQVVYEDGYRFSFVKATEGVGWSDSLFEINMIEGSSAGLLLGAYHFATPTVDDAVDEAEYFVEIAGDYITEGYLKPVLDLEQGSSLGLIVLSNWVHTWMQTVETLTGVEPMIYVNSNYANNFLSASIAQYPLWIAHWTYDPNTTPDIGIWSNWSFWQYSDQGNIEGISGYVDLNVFNGDLLELESFVIKNDIIYVDDDADASWYDATHVHTIQEGIDNASIDHTVFVYNGTYFENVVVDKTIDLIGEKKESTIIDGGLYGDVLRVTADDVYIMNFSIQHSGEVMYQDKAVRISGDNCSFNDNIVAHNAGALYLINSENCTVENNMFYNCTHDIILEEVINSTLKNNHITNCRGVHLIESYYNIISHNQIINTSSGFYVSSSSYNTIIRNNLSNNGNEFYAGFGLLLESSSCDNLIKLNYIFNNTDEGIWLYSGSNNNTISNNHLASNMIGVFLGNSIVDNKVFHNNFYNNIQYNARDYGVNSWDNGYPSGGNYWNDYTGTDGNNDGIGDTPYSIIGGSNQDMYPLMQPWGQQTPNIVYVDDNYDPSVSGWQYDHFDMIQDGIDAVAENGTVYVFNGMYYENVIVNKTIILVGEDRNFTIIDGKNGNAVIITVDSVNISGFFIENSTTGIYCFDINNTSIYENTVSFNEEYGIYLESSFNSTIKGNIIDFVDWDLGIYLKVSSYNTIIDNTVSHCFSGIGLYSSCYNNMIMGNDVHSNNDFGVFLYYANNNTIIQNVVSENHYGIGIGESSNNTVLSNNLINNNRSIIFTFCNQNLLKDNSIVSNNDGDGVELWYSCNNILTGNTISNNSIGLSLKVLNSTSINNIIYNNFFSNIINVVDESGNNRWNISQTPGTNIIGGLYLGGNYWSDYNGYDDDADGIGDVMIPYGPGDFLPLTTLQLDTDQSIFDRGFPLRHALDGDWGAAQNFTPTMNTVTKGEIFLRKMGTPEFDLTVELRQDHPQGTLIDTLLFTPDEIPNTWTWFPLDFNDTEIAQGIEYFIVCPPAPSGVTTSFGYEWGYAFGDQYPDGSFWFTRDGGALWRDLPSMYDFVFKTYGYD